MTTTTNKGADKKLSIYLSTQRLALLTSRANAQSTTLTQCLYALIDELAEPELDLEDVQADIRRLENVVLNSIRSTNTLTATLTVALDGQPQVHVPMTQTQSPFDDWLAAALNGTGANHIAAIVVPAEATTTRVRFLVKSLKVGDLQPSMPSTELALSREQAGPVICHAANSGTPLPLALVGRRVEGTDWFFRFLGKDASGKLTQQIHAFKHPS